MAITGTRFADHLLGTGGDDVLIPWGTEAAGVWDYVSGGEGADVYDLRRSDTALWRGFVIEDLGTDGAADRIVGVDALYQSASLGYSAWATAIRVGDDLFIEAPSKPHRFRDPAVPETHIELRGQYSGAAVEWLEAGGVTYALATGNSGSALADLVAGTDAADVLTGLAGDDWLFGNGGRDLLALGRGDDVAFGGAGADRILGGAGRDRIEGQAGRDTALGAGRDLLGGGAGADWIAGGDGRDRLFGGAGADVLEGGAGRDTLSGGGGADLYRFDAAGWGHDTLQEAGDGGGWAAHDVIELSGFYGPSDLSLAGALARLGAVRAGDDLVIAADGGTSSITVARMFDTDAARHFVEELVLNAGYWEDVHFQILDGAAVNIGDDRAYPLGFGSELNEILIGTAGDDGIYGGSGYNLIWTGAGADVLIYKENDPVPFSGYAAAVSWDIVQDFEVGADLLDFTEMGLTMADLTISADAEGDVLIHWDSGTHEIADIWIELRGVTLAEAGAEIFAFV
jgi:Ca2+-binding RTX toxin-like protein